jgi:hypothetical protein
VNSKDRARLGRIWIETGRGEHASVAAFARFVLHLMSLGSPPDLLLDAIRAMEEEVHHARLCFGIARQFTDEASSPGRMELSGIFDQGDDPGSILRAAILEGCFEETISAAYAQVALERVQEPSIRTALATIAADEARHADLAWRFVSWTIQTYPELRSVAEECFAKAFAKPKEIEQDEWELLEPYGYLRSSSKHEVRAATLRDVIIPRIEALFGHWPTSNLQELILR